MNIRIFEWVKKPIFLPTVLQIALYHFWKISDLKKMFYDLCNLFFGLTSRSDAQRKTTTKNILALEFLLHWLTTVIFQSFSYYFVSFFILLTTFVRGSIKSCVLFALHTRLKVQFLYEREISYNWRFFILGDFIHHRRLFNLGYF